MSTVTATASQRNAGLVEPRNIWLLHHGELLGVAAASQARSIVECIRRRRWPDGPASEQTLCRAMHTCAYRTMQADRAGNKKLVRRRWAARWRTIREHIVKQNIGLVYKTLAEFDATRLDADSLLSDGMYALGRAVDRFDPWRGYHFSTYACNSIIRAMMRCKRRETRYREAYPIHYEPDFEQPERSHQVETDLYLERLQLILRDNSAELTPVEWGVLHRRFLRDGNRQPTFEAIGDEIGLCKERIRQIQNKALAKLRAVAAGSLSPTG